MSWSSMRMQGVVIIVCLYSGPLPPSSSDILYHLHWKRIAASKVGRVAERKQNFESFVIQLNPSRRVVTADVQRGIDMKPVAANAYANITKQRKVNLYPSGLIINPKLP